MSPPQLGRRRFVSRIARSATLPGLRGPFYDVEVGSAIRYRETITRRLLAAAGVMGALAATAVVLEWVGGDVLHPTTLLMGALVVAIHKIAGMYDRDDLVMRRSTLDEMPVIVQLTSIYTLSVAAVSGALFEVQPGPQQLVALWVSTALLVAALRMAARSVAHAAAPRERCLIVGDRDRVGHVRRKIEQNIRHAEVVGAVPLGFGPHHGISDVTDMRALVERHDVHRVVLAPSGQSSAETASLVRLAKGAGVRISILPRVLEAVGSAVEFEQIDGMVMLGVRRFGLSRSSRAIKRGFDIAVGAGILLALLPVLALIVLLVRLDSPGPIFFRQTRIGRDGEPFRIWKFRSMVVDAEALKASLIERNETEGLFKLSGDPRVTRVGRWLRSTSLDELPQMLNVLTGDMSLVGPRPLVADEDALIRGIYRSRLHLTPGMTGPWQILGSSRVPLNEMLGIDYLYVANWSLWEDIKILLRTIPHSFGRRGL